MTRVTMISDLHGHYPKLPGGDLLIVAGDLTARDLPKERHMFLQWFAEQDYRKKIWIAGNHDNSLVGLKFDRIKDDSAEYLCDSGTEFEGLKIWGSPWSLKFPGMNPQCMAFTCDTEEELEDKWELIPEDVDILVTHSPPYGILDFNGREHCGSSSLRNYTLNGNKFNKKKLHVFGHIHENGGNTTDYCFPRSKSLGLCSGLFVNASHVNENYKPVNAPITIEL